MSMTMSPESCSSLNPPASVAAEPEIPKGKFVLAYDKLDAEAIIRSVQDDTEGATALCPSERLESSIYSR